MCFFAFMFSLFSLLLYVFIDVRLSQLNKDYLLTYLLTTICTIWGPFHPVMEPFYPREAPRLSRR